MARSVGSLDFDIMDGYLGDLAIGVDVYVNAGQDGVGAQQVGMIDGSARLRGLKYTSGGPAFVSSCKALQGTTQTCIDALGNSKTCLIRKVDDQSGHGGKGAVIGVIQAGSAVHECEVIFSVEVLPS